ncbi:Oxidoreductase molybdopterin binding domain protein [Phaeobacter sp. CECT 5382]|uniref:molybdopterin-dependent oxidoreductase n=1 Tax=Phaeobacter sp. CECT 5382 TaxID=1712645 RepID=UPI0006DABCC1|nr:molybdopterin-dependent oxidoreductase [Phaeobacter sp. CECT 5382]CUH88974.1 Oxidoreductase molybdopterin binding domain protein [Phaeobacter sp. CECT 5382]
MFNWGKFLPIAALVAFVAFGGPSQAETVSQQDAAGVQSSEEILLTIEVVAEAGLTQKFTLSQLRAMGAESFETETIWTTGVQRFTGVPLVDLIAPLEVKQGVLQARAVNDYMIEIPLSDAVEGGPIIAYERNGKTMPLRSKGPLWLVYPYDSNPAYKTEAIYSRSIWQLESLSIATVTE